MLAWPDVLGSLEHHVLEEMREPGAALPLVARTDVVVDGDREHRSGVILRDDHAQAVLETVSVNSIDRGGAQSDEGCQRQGGRRGDEDPSGRKSDIPGLLGRVRTGARSDCYAEDNGKSAGRAGERQVYGDSEGEGRFSVSDAVDRKRNAKHPAKVLTLVVGHRHRTIPARPPYAPLPVHRTRDGCGEIHAAEPPTGG